MTAHTIIFRRFAAGLWKSSSRGRSLGLLLLFLAVGCRAEPEITQYTIDTREPEQLRTEQRLLGAIVPQGDAVWFFKAVGPSEDVEPLAEEIRRWVASVRFERNEPVLDVPDQWERRPGDAMRFATLEIPTDDLPLELSVSRLSRTAEWEPLVAMNVNRWRQQMGLESSDAPYAGAEPLAGEAASDGAVGDDGAAAMWVDLSGSFGGGPSTMAPFAGGAGAMRRAPFSGGDPAPPGPGTGGERPPATANSDSADARRQTESGGLTYEVPEGWRPGETSSMRLAAFEVGPEEREAQLTVIPAGGGERDNIKRWLGQIRPDGVDDALVDQVIDEAQEVTVDGRESRRFLLPGSGEPPMATDVTIVPLGDGFSMFIKLTGDARTVAEQSDNVAQFLDSLELNR